MKRKCPCCEKISYGMMDEFLRVHGYAGKCHSCGDKTCLPVRVHIKSFPSDKPATVYLCVPCITALLKDWGDAQEDGRGRIYLRAYSDFTSLITVEGTEFLDDLKRK